MTPKPRKRSRAAVDDKRADCPFEVTMASPPAVRDDRDIKAAKKRKGEAAAGESDKKLFYQISPFEPTGKFRTLETLDIRYLVEPRKRWTDMTRYNSFVLNGNKYLSEAFVFVANDEAIERLKSGKIEKNQVGPGDFWVARILEIRASDEHHVYARVFWMYSPDELPPATMAGKKTAAGRQPYHGINELIASNHMDIINVVSVVQPANVNQWIESDDEEIQDAMYWRQAFDCQTSQLSSIDLTCRCQTPANPDKTLVGCTNSECGKWMHLECLREDVLKRIYHRLGTDRPHIARPPEIKKENKEDDTIKRESPQAPLSPPKIEDEQPQAMIAVHGDANTDALVKQADEVTPKSAAEQTTTPPAAEPDHHNHPHTQTQKIIKGVARRKAGRGGRPSAAFKPYLGLFEANLRMNEGPMVWEITDLRQGVTGGAKTWIESATCLLCYANIE